MKRRLVLGAVLDAVLRGLLFTAIYFAGVVLIPIEEVPVTVSEALLYFAGFTVLWFLFGLWRIFRK